MSLSLGLYFIAAILVAFGSVLAVVTASRYVDQIGPNVVVGFYTWMILLGPTARFITAPRLYEGDDTTAADYTAVAGWVSWVLRLSSLSLVALACAVILMGLIHRRVQGGGAWLALGLGSLLFAMLTGSVLGERPTFVHNHYYAILLMGSLFMLPKIPPEQVAVHAKRILTLIMIGSLVLGALFTSRFAQTQYEGVIPGLTIRLHGLASHANSLAPMALLYMLLAYWVTGSRLWQVVGWIAAILVFVLAQSKTVWIAAILCVLTITAYRLHHRFADEIRQGRLGWATLVMFGIGVLAGLSVLWLLSDTAGALLHNVRQDQNVTSLTGRTDIWRTTIETWERNPLFGYGPKLWDLEFRLKNGAALYAWHAHNQYLQALGEAGLVGLTAQVLYTCALIYYGFRFASRTGGVSVALLLLLLVRTISEIPLRLNVMLDTTFFVHFAVFTVFLMLSREEAAQPGEHRPARLQAAAA